MSKWNQQQSVFAIHSAASVKRYYNMSLVVNSTIVGFVATLQKILRRHDVVTTSCTGPEDVVCRRRVDVET